MKREASLCRVCNMGSLTTWEKGDEGKAVREKISIAMFPFASLYSTMIPAYSHSTINSHNACTETVAGIATVVAYGGSLTQSINQPVWMLHHMILLPISDGSSTRGGAVPPERLSIPHHPSFPPCLLVGIKQISSH